MSTFYDIISEYKWNYVKELIYSRTEKDVFNALNSNKRSLEDFAALISPAAEAYLENMAQQAHSMTIERFGKIIQLYIPLYLSNICTNNCVYCGFSIGNSIKRKKLTMEEIDREIKAIKNMGYKHILLVAGEADKIAGADYYKQVVDRIRKDFSHISLEVQPLDTHEYESLHDSGIGFVCVYQETYNEETYNKYHTFGKKMDYRYRLETPDRIGSAGIQKIGIGALLGLEDWRVDSFFTALHLRYLEKKYWQTKYSISLPRLRPATGEFEPQNPINDKGMVQLICAYRLFDREVDISLSTRESRKFRDNVLSMGITSISAGSSTEPGGYVESRKELQQFSINDDRSPQEMAAALKQKGYEAVWKDWDFWM